MSNTIETRIRNLTRKFKTKKYKKKEYFKLTEKERKELTKELKELLLLIHVLQKEEQKNKNWWRKNGQTFKEGFNAFWMRKYIITEYFNAIQSKLIETLLNDPNDTGENILYNIRKNQQTPKEYIKLIVGLSKAYNKEECVKTIKKYPVKIEPNILNLTTLMKYELLKIWIPIQVFFAKLIAHRFWFWKKTVYITKEQLNDLQPFLKKGDILLQRTNFKLSNALMPGFWTHAMLFDGEKIIESTPNKVRRIKWKKAAKSDYLCVLRPKCTEEEKEKAINYAKKQIGKKYDFTFNFLSDKAIVCTELVLKAYPCLKPKLEVIGGWTTYPPVNFIKLYNEKKLDFVYFLDGRMNEERAVLGTPKELKETIRRSKWDLLQK